MHPYNDIAHGYLFFSASKPAIALYMLTIMYSVTVANTKIIIPTPPPPLSFLRHPPLLSHSPSTLSLHCNRQITWDRFLLFAAKPLWRALDQQSIMLD